jgi:hypothetical protein
VPILAGSDPAITADASQIYFVRNKDIWVADRGASIYEWTNQRSIGAPVNTAAAEVRPFVTADGSKLFFSDFGGIRAGGYGGSDIWVSTWTGTAWGTPVNFGPPVNTDRVTCTPFLNRDGTLFYTASESFEGSRGCEDIWVSYLDQSPAPQVVAPAPGTWTKLGELDGAWNVYDLVRGGDGALYAATMPDAVVFRSEDDGVNWTPTSPLPNAIIAYSLLAATDGTLYAGTYPNGDVFRSTDGGQVWSPTSNLPASTAVRALLETSDGRILAGTSPLCRVYATTNRGLTWTQLGPTVAMESSVTRLFETSGGALLAGGWGKLNRSTNGGAQWAPASFPAAFAGEVMSIESFLEQDGAVWTTGWVHGHGGYVFRSMDGGASWDSTGTIRIGEKRAVRVYDIAGAPDGRLFIGLQPGPDQVALASADGGATWEVEGDLAGAHEVLRFLKTADGAVLAATTPNGDVYRWAPGASGLPLDPKTPGSPGSPEVDPESQAAARGVAAVLGGEPNPFTRSTTIRFQLPAAGYAHLCVADARGVILRRLAQGPLEAGEHAVVWNGRDDGGRRAPRGVYFVRLAAAGRVTWQKVVRAW